MSKKPSKAQGNPPKEKFVSWRVSAPVANLLNRAEQLTKRTRTSLIEECILRAAPSLINGKAGK